MIKLGSLSKKIQEFFDLGFVPHLSLGRKVVPMYVVNSIPRDVDTIVESQAAAVQNTWYDLLDIKGAYYLDNVTVMVDTANEDLEWELYLDGNQYDGARAGSVAGTTYYVSKSPVAAGQCSSNSSQYNWLWRASGSFAESLLLRVRKTSANGAGALTVTAHVRSNEL